MPEYDSDVSPSPQSGLSVRPVLPSAAPAADRPDSPPARRRLRRLGSAVATLAVSLGMAVFGMTALASAPAEAASYPSAVRNWPTLRQGANGPAVTYVQKRLHQVRDGWFGPQTRAAVNKYKKKHHLKANGVVGRGVWAALGVPHRVKAGPHQWPVLRVKSYGPAVTYVKKRLKVGTSSNWFGAGAAAGVKRFKKNHGLRANAVVGKGVWQALGVDYRKPAKKKKSNGIPQRVQNLHWGALAQCESGGNPRAVNSAGYYGLYQFALRTWHAVGGSGNPIYASKSEQTYRAQVLYVRAGAGQWPVCGRHLF